METSTTSIPNSPLISVGIPVYNLGDFLKECLDSIANQTLNNIEIIAVDDCSTDHSFQILTTYTQADSRFKVIRHTLNQGANAARKTALTHARGEYVIFIDGDDWIHPTMLEQLYTHSNQGEKDVVICKLALQYGKNLSIPYVQLSPKTIATFNQNPIHILPTGINPGFTNKIWKTKLFHEPGVAFLNIPFGEDLAVTSKLFFYAKKIAFVDQALYYYRLDHKTTVPTKAEVEKKILKRLAGELDLYKNLLEFFTPHDLNEEIITLLGKRNYWFYNYLQDIIKCNSKVALEVFTTLLKEYHGTSSVYPINFTKLKLKAFFFNSLHSLIPKKIYYLLLYFYIKYLK